MFVRAMGQKLDQEFRFLVEIVDSGVLPRTFSKSKRITGLRVE
jgi:hypothetical protein